ncbi:MAG: family 78 glycoside hydrolase catalytic domain, partial [Lachnospiraceae bacterium]|nr:family 78 glycoside hydrolase catalytic domain [Lachnospiraceae bacterium]
MHAIHLRTEYLKNPVGLGNRSPRLIWNCAAEDGASSNFQTAYEIIAKDDCGETLWESGKVTSSSMQAVWDGAFVPEKTLVTWSVRLYDENDLSGEWVSAAFETGLDPESWKAARWIAGDYKVNPKLRYPADCFRKSFSTASDSPVKKARLYITACGLYEARLNGRKAGESVLAPGYTDYRKRIQYQTIDVTELLTGGENTLTVQLADGWYRGSCGAWGLKNQYGTETKLLLILEITFEDGTVQQVCSDGSFEWSNDGPVRFTDNKDGEKIDARMTPSYSGRAKVTSHPVVPTASDNVLLKEHETLKPQVLTTPAGKTVLDFGQNIAGYISFSANAEEGQKIRLRFGELIDQDGEFTQKNIQCSNKKKTTPLQEVDYICREGRNDYKTTFAIFGFQYVLVEGDPVEWTPEDFTAIAVYSDMEETGRFSSSNELLDKLVDSTRWSAKNNHADLPTDCPTRERHGWAGDAQIFCRTASYLFSYAPMARKYENDLIDGSRKNGCFPQIAPRGGVDAYMNSMDGSAGWSDAGVFIPYDIYRMYRDTKILSDNYDVMCRYARFKIGTLGKWYMTSRPTGIERKNRKNISNYGQSY